MNRKGSGSINTFDFDLGLGSGRSNKSLNDQKQKGSTTTPSSGFSTMQQQSKPSWQYNNSKPSWTHQPVAASVGSGIGAAGLNGPTSMVGDITGRSWNSTAPSSGIGIVNKNPNLFGDLVGSALGHNKSNSNVPLKNVNSNQGKGAFSVGSMADSLPKTGGAGRTGTTNAGLNAGSNAGLNSRQGGAAESFGSYTSGLNNGVNSSGIGVGGPPLKAMGGANGKSSGGMGASKDPFGSLGVFEIKRGGVMSSGIGGGKSSAADDSFGDFQKAPKSGGIGSVGVKANVADDSFGTFHNAGKTSSPAYQSNAFPAGQDDLFGSSSSFDDFTMPAQTQSRSFSSTVDPLDALFSSTSSSGGTGAASGGGHQPTEVDFGLETEFGGHDDGGTTTELEGLPPPPSGVSASAAKSKGLENYKQGQFADAIKWLSWAVVLLEKGGNNVAEVLSSRASCFKEVGEYKKAVADCTKVLDNDSKNVIVLVQRALLYESMEKYKLGAEDLKAVLKLDPMNRVARSTVHRLTQMAG